jgi:flagellar motor switch protein FliN/FliY
MAEPLPPNDPVAALENAKLKKLENVEVNLKVEAGSIMLTLRELLTLKIGSVIALDTEAGAQLDILTNGTLIARGEVVNIGGTLGIRVLSIVDPADRHSKARL